MELDLVAVLMSAAALFIAGLSLGWQIVVWLLSGGRPESTLVHGVLTDSGSYVGPVRKNGRGYDIRALGDQGIVGVEVVGIQVTNHGRIPINVERVSVLTRGGGMTLTPIGERIGVDMPAKIEPGTNESWYIERVRGDQLVAASREALQEQVSGIYMSAQLGSGKITKTRHTLLARVTGSAG